MSINRYLKLKEINFLNKNNNDTNNKLINHKCFDFNEPIVLRNYCKNTNAVKTWNLDFFSTLFSGVKFTVEVYDDDTDLTQDNGFEQYNIKEIIKHYKNGNKPHIYCAQIDLNKIDSIKSYISKCFNTEEHENKNQIKQNNITENNTKQNNINKIPEERLLFFGDNSKSGCHVHIQDDYLLNQIFGTKTIYLFNYHDNSKHVTCNFLNKKNNFITEDFFKLDHSKMKIYKVTLNAGDSLIIPPWWWHATEGHNINCSVTHVYLRYDLNYLYNKPYLMWLYIYTNYLEEIVIYLENNHQITKLLLLIILIIITIMVIYVAYILHK